MLASLEIVTFICLTIMHIATDRLLGGDVAFSMGGVVANQKMHSAIFGTEDLSHSKIIPFAVKYYFLFM